MMELTFSLIEWEFIDKQEEEARELQVITGQSLRYQKKKKVFSLIYIQKYVRIFIDMLYTWSSIHTVFCALSAEKAKRNETPGAAS